MGCMGSDTNSFVMEKVYSMNQTSCLTENYKEEDDGVLAT